MRSLVPGSFRSIGLPGACGREYETHDRRTVHASIATTWAVVETIGGKNGFFSWPLAWAVRAEIDAWAGGPGFAQHRAHPGRLTVGDTIDFLTVTAVEPGHYVRFATDRWSPGIGALEVWIDPGSAEAAGTSKMPDSQSISGPDVILHLRATWQPDGLSGQLYWFALKPFHLIIFPEMLRRIAELAEQDGARPGLSAERLTTDTTWPA